MVSLKVYAFTFILSVVVFALGIFIGTTLENERQKAVEQDILQYQSDLENVVLQYSLIEADGVQCDLYPDMFKELYAELDRMGKTLEDYQSQGKYFELEFGRIKQRYTTLSIRTWLLLEKVRQRCPNRFSTILYFYSSLDCEDCLAQGVVLDALKKKHGQTVMIFPIDADFSNPSTRSLLTYFNITGTPSLVLDSNRTFNGMTERTPLESLFPIA